ncbi:hypothetical protein EJB05_43533, partial [Eragrostis curvula]
MDAETLNISLPSPCMWEPSPKFCRRLRWDPSSLGHQTITISSKQHGGVGREQATGSPPPAAPTLCCCCDQATTAAGIKDVKPVGKKEHKRGLSTAERDPKTLRRLAQNREAARKSRLRKKLT